MPKLSARASYYLGVDIGKKGGLAVIDEAGAVFASTIFPETYLDAAVWIKSLLAELEGAYYGYSLRAVVEKVWAFPGVSKSTAFSMGGSLAAIETTLSIYGIPYVTVAAVTWQKRYNLPSRAAGQLDNKEHKERLRAIAQKQFPKFDLWSQPKTKGLQLAVCDSLLIADYCRRLNAGGN